jgi:hypothetical protein
MDTISASKKTIAFGDLSRFVVHAVQNNVEVFRYDEVYKPNHQLGWQSLGCVQKANLMVGSASDKPPSECCSSTAKGGHGPPNPAVSLVPHG